MSVVTATPLSEASLTAVTANFGVKARLPQPVTVRGAELCFEPLSLYESAAMANLAGGDGQLVGMRTPFRVVFSSLTEICTGPTVSGMPLNATFTPASAGRIWISPAVPSALFVSSFQTSKPARSPGLGGATRYSEMVIGAGTSTKVTVPVPIWQAE